MSRCAPEFPGRWNSKPHPSILPPFPFPQPTRRGVSPSTIGDVVVPLVSSQPALQSQTGAALFRRRELARAIELWHLASLDAPTVAVVWALGFAWAAGVHLDPWVPLLLACGTWSVYIGDRLLDARRAIRARELDCLRERHYFHWRYRHVLAPVAFCSAAIAAFLILRLMPLAVRERDSVIAAAALAYFSGVHSPARLPAWMAPIVSKELLVGLLFTSGCAAPVMAHLHARAAGASELTVMGGVVFFALLAWLNCAAIEAWEASGQRAIRFFAATLCAIGAIAGLALLQRYSHGGILLCTGSVSAFLLFQLDRMQHRIAPLTVRALADLVLLTPAVLLLLRAHHA